MDSKQCFPSVHHKYRPTSCILFIILSCCLQCLELNLGLQALFLWAASPTHCSHLDNAAPYEEYQGHPDFSTTDRWVKQPADKPPFLSRLFCTLCLWNWQPRCKPCTCQSVVRVPPSWSHCSNLARSWASGHLLLESLLSGAIGIETCPPDPWPEMTIPKTGSLAWF